jgi:uncharacterized protein YgiM (DUF1202 family)
MKDVLLVIALLALGAMVFVDNKHQQDAQNSLQEFQKQNSELLSEVNQLRAQLVNTQAQSGALQNQLGRQNAEMQSKLQPHVAPRNWFQNRLDGNGGTLDPSTVH